MAESVKRRVAAARLAVAFVAAGAITGAAYAQAGPTPPEAHSSLLVSSIKNVKLGSSNIKNGSLLFQDFKPGQVVSGDTFFKYEKADNAYKAQIQGELGNVNGDINAIKGELPSYIKMNDADARYLKADASVVRGDGSVFTATKESSNALIGLLDVPDLVSVDALPGGDAVRITNISGNDLQHSSCQAPAGGVIGAGTLKPNETLDCATGQQTNAMQMIGGSGGSEVATLNFTKIGTDVTVQVLVGL
jgi:hypothetical protein